MTAPEPDPDRPLDRWRVSGEPVEVLRPELLDPEPTQEESTMTATHKDPAAVAERCFNCDTDLTDHHVTYRVLGYCQPCDKGAYAEFAADRLRRQWDAATAPRRRLLRQIGRQVTGADRDDP